MTELFRYFQVCDFFSKLIYHPSSSDSLLADIFSIMSHLSRKSEDVVVTIIKILKGTNQQNYQILIKSLSGNPVVKSRCCNMLGNLMRYNDAFYDVLKKNKQIFDLLVRCSQLDELNVRKVRSLV